MKKQKSQGRKSMLSSKANSRIDWPCAVESRKSYVAKSMRLQNSESSKNDVFAGPANENAEGASAIRRIWFMLKVWFGPTVGAKTQLCSEQRVMLPRRSGYASLNYTIFSIYLIMCVCITMFMCVTIFSGDKTAVINSCRKLRQRAFHCH
jgi:hypothetical protein